MPNVRPDFRCLRCGVFPIKIVGCCRDCYEADPQEAARITRYARQFRTKSGTPLPKAQRRPFHKATP